ncbi:MAG: hypothetical protein WBN23_03685 [Woeseia sp.]
MTFPDSDHGITVAEISPMDQPIQWRSATTAAFLGRSLRGPLNTPVLVRSVGEFSRYFGGRWKRSSLFDAVEQFFLHGGQRLYIVRVASNAQGATLKLPGPGGDLELRALDPGTTEVLRAAVDYDGIDDDIHFNLTLQRLSPDTRLVIDQEIFSGISLHRNAAEFAGDVLNESTLVEVRLPLPGSRPLATMGPAAMSRAPYILPVSRGSDGGELCDYDIVGSAIRGTGLFSLEAIDDLDLVYVPPLAPAHDLGPAVLMAAELYCSRRAALLVMDPPGHWQDARSAAAHIEAAGLASANIVSYFPRLVTAAVAGQEGTTAAGAAIAGLLCKLDAQHGPWASLESAGYAFGRSLRPQQVLQETDRHLLQRAGVNAIMAAADGRQVLRGDITMAHAAATDVLNSRLSMKRFSLKIARTIERATRWAVFEQDRALAAERVERQVEELLHLLAQRGAIFAAFVRCETHHDAPEMRSERGLAVMLTLQCAAAPEPISLTVYQTASGCRVTSTAFAPVVNVAELRHSAYDAA